MTKTHDEFILEVRDLVGDEYFVLNKYLNAKTKVKILHNLCENSWEITPHNFLRGFRCPTCATKRRIKSRRKSHDVFLDEVRELCGEEYSVIGNYFNTSTKIEMRHNICGNYWNVTPDNFLRGRRCPTCSLKLFESRLATEIKEYCCKKYNAKLEHKEFIDYENRKKRGGFLFYDIFFVHNNIKYYIEIHGEQHYRFTKHWHDTIENYKLYQNRDKAKKKYANTNGVFLEINKSKNTFEDAIQFINEMVKKHGKR